MVFHCPTDYSPLLASHRIWIPVWPPICVLARERSCADSCVLPPKMQRLDPRSVVDSDQQTNIQQSQRSKKCLGPTPGANRKVGGRGAGMERSVAALAPEAAIPANNNCVGTPGNKFTESCNGGQCPAGTRTARTENRKLLDCLNVRTQSRVIPSIMHTRQNQNCVWIPIA